jgi:hypothetical protein
MGLVLGQHDRAIGKFGDGVAQPGQDLVRIGVALGDQPGPPPAGDLADPPAQGALADGRSAQPLPSPSDCPGLGLGEQPAEPLAKPVATPARPTRPWPVGKPVGAVGVVTVDPAAHRRRVAAQQASDGGG